MSGHGSSSEKGVNTSLICQESYACGGSEEAAFECDDCKSLQCVRCEVELHSQERLKNHERVQIGPRHVPYCDNCKGANGDSGKRHRSVVRCQNCKVNLCQDCQKRTHSGSSKKKHQLTPYPPPPKPEEAISIQSCVQPSVKIADETKSQRAKLLEKVSSFLLVDENEEMQVSWTSDTISLLHHYLTNSLYLKVFFFSSRLKTTLHSWRASAATLTSCWKWCPSLVTQEKANPTPWTTLFSWAERCSRHLPHRSHAQSVCGLHLTPYIWWWSSIQRGCLATVPNRAREPVFYSRC